MSKNRQTTQRKPLLLGAVVVAALVAACTGDDGSTVPKPGASDETVTGSVAAALSNGPVGLALEIDNGNGVPLRVIRGQPFYLNQIDMRVSTNATTDEGVSGLARTGDFRDLCWAGTRLVDQQFLLTPNAEGKFTRQRFFRDAAWMNQKSEVTLQQRAASGAANRAADDVRDRQGLAARRQR